MKNKKQKFYESPSVTADTVIFTVDGSNLKVLLIKRKYPPFADKWALPGVFLLKNESAYQAANRALTEKAGIKVSYIEQLYTFDSLYRDPRGHIVTIAYFALVPNITIKTKKSPSLQTPALFPAHKAPDLAFDHKAIIKYAALRLRAKLIYTNVIYSLLPNEFTLTRLQKTYEAVLGQKLDKRNFRKKYLSLGLIKPVGKKIKGIHQRPASLYQFKSRKPTELKKFF